MSEVDGFAATLSELDAVVDRSRERKERSGFFAALYRSVTHEVATRTASGQFEQPARMERFVTRFAARYLDAPEKAGDVIAAFSRADEVIDWTHFLIAEERKRLKEFRAEEAKLRSLETMLKNAKLNWHEFDLSKSRQQADEVFTEATKIKNGLWKGAPAFQRDVRGQRQ